MRAGAFTEMRVIDLLNQRFVPFYFNTGGPGLGRDPAAEAFVKDKMKNPFAYLAAFTPSGELLGTTEVYADKDDVFEFLKDLLDRHPEFATPTNDEFTIIAAADSNDPVSVLKAAKLHEVLGDYGSAEPLYRKILGTSGSLSLHNDSYRALARIARYQKEWDSLESILQEVEKSDTKGVEGDVVMERAYALMDAKKHMDVRKLLESAIAEHPESDRIAEFRFYAGVAAFFLDDTEHAYHHWCWVVENLPENPMQRRCYIAAAHKGMPYPNPELGGFKSNHPGGSTLVIKSAYDAAREVYLKIEDEAQGR